ncbi:MAG TPA: class I adenylate-forming enzyme family protein [Bacilli bacterium]|nr:class I adenylate-forming enzyme family protein [Bacilli bacterium]
MIDFINITKILEVIKNYKVDKTARFKTGFASIDRPWDKNKTEIKLPDSNIYDGLMNRKYFKVGNTIAKCHEDILTKQSFEAEVEKYAKSFKAIGVKKGEIVPICMQPCNEAIIVFFALNRIGAISTFLNSTSSKEEIDLYINKYNASNIVLSSKYANEANDIAKYSNINKALVISPKDSFKKGMNISEFTKEYIDSFDKKINEDNRVVGLNTFKKYSDMYNGKLDDIGKGSDIACITYTSGSTGEPKSVVLTNENVMAEMLSIKKTTHMDIGPNGNSLQVVPFNYPYGFLISTLFPIFVGKTAALTPMITLKTIFKYLEMYKPKYIQAIPSFFKALMKNYDEKMRYLWFTVSGGDTYDFFAKKDNNKYFKEHGSPAKIKDGCGTAEGGGCITTSVIFGKGNPYSVGKPIKGVNIKIIDPDTGEELPYGKVGKFCFSGKNVMSGYYQDGKVVDVRVTDENGVKWFYTDTYAHMNSDGFLFLDGRDRRFFITYDQEGSAFKVYGDYVQSIVKECDDVFDCAVVKKPDDTRELVPKAYVVLKDNKVMTKEIADKIYAICIKKLKRCEIPVEIEQVESIPLTRAEKNDYAALEKKAQEEYNEINQTKSR